MEKQNLIHRYLILVVFLGLLCSDSKAQNPTPSPNSESLSLVSVQFDKWRNNEASFFELLDDDVVWTISGKSPFSGIYQGKRNFIECAVNPILEKLKTPLKPELISLTADSLYVWLHFKAIATTHSNYTYENNYLWKMDFRNNKIIKCTAFFDTHELTILMYKNNITMNKTIEETKQYIGMWVTKDGYIRHELLPNNRYDEARGNRKSAYQGSYKIKGNHIDYKDDTGFTADGYFKDGILYHAGMILYKE